MKFALLGDIHGNHYALESVIESALNKGVDKFLVTGDLVGYYFSPLKVLNLLNTLDASIVRGNHEEMLAAAINNSVFLNKIDKKYGPGIRIAIQELDEKQLSYLINLPHPLFLEFKDKKIILCHGSLNDINKYIYPDTEQVILDNIDIDEYDILVTGHTHYPMKKFINNNKIIINPGSVGQPRNRKPGAHWALLDTTTNDISFHCENYDFMKLIQECRKFAPNLSYLENVLTRT